MKKSKNDLDKLPEGMPAPLDELTPRQFDYYCRMGAIIQESSHIIPLDVVLLTQIAVGVDLAEQARAAIEKNGTVQVYKSGARAVSPEVQLWNTVSNTLDKLFSSMGLTAKVRQTIRENQLKKGFVDPLDGLIDT